MHAQQQTALFSSLAESECEQIDARLKRREYPPQTVIVRERAPGGRTSVTLEGKPIALRVSPVPGKWGEKIVLRLLDKSHAATEPCGRTLRSSHRI